MRNKGFTLIELLAVILILGIIALIAIPIIGDIIEQAKEGAFKTTISNIVSIVETKCEVERLKGKEVQKRYVFTSSGVTPKIEVKGKLPITGYVDVNNDCEIKIKDLSDGKNKASKSFESSGIVITAVENNNSNYLDLSDSTYDITTYPTMIKNDFSIVINKDGYITIDGKANINYFIGINKNDICNNFTTCSSNSNDVVYTAGSNVNITVEKISGSIITDSTNILNLGGRGSVNKQGIIVNAISDTKEKITTVTEYNISEGIYLFYFFVARNSEYDNLRLKVSIEGN